MLKEAQKYVQIKEEPIMAVDNGAECYSCREVPISRPRLKVRKGRGINCGKFLERGLFIRICAEAIR